MSKSHLPSSFHRFSSLTNWEPPKSFRSIRTIDLHTEGEPLRVIVAGFPPIEGNTILEYRSFVQKNLDHFRTALMWEPRGHADMYGCLLTPPVNPEADFGTFFLHNEGYSTMCGHAIIALATLAVETQMVPVVEPETCIKIDTPAGLVTAFAKVSNGKVNGVYFHNVPSFVTARNETVEVPGMGTITYDLAFGGAFYAYVDAGAIDVSMAPENFRGLIEAGMAIKRAVMDSSTNIVHPFEPDLSFLYGTIFTGAPLPMMRITDEIVHSRNVCIFAEGEVDRSPTGTGVSGRMALHHAKGDISIGQEMTIESILGSTFTGSVIEAITFGGHAAVIPKVSGTAYITGRHEFLIDPDDPLKDGFIFR
ncbi:UNVERIFIED_CONTAM: hypothetical protein GTU68_043147 [Idotea baltica]|nr:hypothetical protein [Idotea baltica]